MREQCLHPQAGPRTVDSLQDDIMSLSLCFVLVQKPSAVSEQTKSAHRSQPPAPSRCMAVCIVHACAKLAPDMMHACMHCSALVWSLSRIQTHTGLLIRVSHRVQEEAAPRPTTSITHRLDTFPQALSGNSGRDDDLWGSILSSH